MVPSVRAIVLCNLQITRQRHAPIESSHELPYGLTAVPSSLLETLERMWEK